MKEEKKEQSVVEEREEGYMCTLLCTESGRNVRASVRNVVPLLVTVTSARAREPRAVPSVHYIMRLPCTRARRDAKEKERRREGARKSE